MTVIRPKTTQQTTTTTMFQGRGMAWQRIRRLHTLPLRHIFTSCHVVASRSARFVCLFVRSFVSLVGCCDVSLPLVVAHPIPLHRHTMSLHCILSLVVPLISLSLSLRVVASRLASSLPSRRRTSTLMPSLLIFLSWLDVC